jgi:hypothetical protein
MTEAEWLVDEEPIRLFDSIAPVPSIRRQRLLVAPRATRLPRSRLTEVGGSGGTFVIM